MKKELSSSSTCHFKKNAKYLYSKVSKERCAKRMPQTLEKPYILKILRFLYLELFRFSLTALFCLLSVRRLKKASVFSFFNVTSLQYDMAVYAMIESPARKNKLNPPDLLRRIYRNADSEKLKTEK